MPGDCMICMATHSNGVGILPLDTQMVRRLIGLGAVMVMFVPYAAVLGALRWKTVDIAVHAVAMYGQTRNGHHLDFDCA